MSVTFNCGSALFFRRLIGLLCCTGMLLFGCTTFKARKFKSKAELELKQPANKVARENAIKYYQQSLALYKDLENHHEAALLHRSLAQLLSEEEPQQACEHLLEAFQIWQELGQTQLAYEALHQCSGQQFQRALPEKKWIKIVKDLEQLAAQLELYDDQAQFALKIYELTANKHYQQTALALAKSQGKSEIQDHLWQVEARIHRTAGDFLEALSAYNKRLQAFSDRPDAEKEALLRIETLPLLAMFQSHKMDQELEIITKQSVEANEPTWILSCQESLLTVLQEQGVHLQFTQLMKQWDNLIVPKLSNEEQIKYYLNLALIQQNLGQSGAEELEKAQLHFLPPLENKYLLHAAQIALQGELPEQSLQILHPLVSQDPAQEQHHFDIYLKIIHAYILQQNPTEAQNILVQGFKKLDPQKEKVKVKYLVSAAQIFQQYEYVNEALSVLNMIPQNFYTGRGDTDLSAQILHAYSLLYHELGDHFNAIHTTHNEYGLHSQKKGLELLKAEIYSRIGEYSLQTGILDLKFNPFDIALNFLQDIPIRGLYPELFYQKSLSLQRAKPPQKKAIATAYLQWYNEIAYDYFLANSDLLPQIEDIVTFLTKNKFDYYAFAFLDQVMRREHLYSIINHRKIEHLAIDPLLLGKSDKSFKNNQVFDLLLLCEKSRSFALRSIQHELRLEHKEQKLLSRKLKVWQKYNQDYERLLHGLVNDGFNLEFLRFERYNFFQTVLNSIPEDTLVIRYFQLGTEMYVFSYVHNEVRFWGSVAFQTGQVFGERSDKEKKKLYTELLAEPLSQTKTWKRLMIITDIPASSVSFKELLVQSSYKSAVKTMIQLRALDLHAGPKTDEIGLKNGS